ncbi:hypothetical protein AWB80_04223 [Caballeronia pedi]|uniref:Uncharacterized protein n=2 Tax=Caballeronia pedi TaxID=1777141 RepID=A0A158BWB7_9BURK|nr:hypothetical protein AWB80_04223 [Caballeronia pedi]
MTAGSRNDQRRRGETPVGQTDFSSKELSIRRLSLVEEYIADRRQYRKFRHIAFFGVAGLIITLVAILALWIRSFGLRIFGGSVQIDHSQALLFIAPIVVIASLVAVSLLPTVRLVFREGDGKEDDKDSLTIWQTLVKELADLLKQYVGRSRPTA